ncbi:hypothetical protein VM98_21780 [Streptomyces rubellomurinus subsp. indigoferus]|nr:hypothetical protein VM98_21780 [Streptomyces rubellomurinus subsp. indigoferus]
MAELAHATLQRLRVDRAGGKDRPPLVKGDGPAVEVQFNPVSLRLSRNNNVDRGGVGTRTEKRQNPSAEPAVLAFDLAFDTAEQGGPGAYTDVREWTAVVRQFVEPPPRKKGDPPPIVRFQWGTFRFDGIVTQVTEELDLFAPDGTPLRAKVGVSVTEQDFGLEAHEKGAGARDARAATDPGTPPAGSTPGTAGTNRPQQVVQARGGESAQQLLARLGLDPAAWRAAMRGLDSPLGLTAGFNVHLGVEVEAGGGLGLSAGFAGEAAATSVAGLAGALGLGPDAEGAAPSSGSGTDDLTAAGFALSAGGGIAASLSTVTGARAARAVDLARGAFAVPGPVPPTGAAPPPDPRALTYGQGVPLRSRADADTRAEAETGGARSLAGRARARELPPPDGVTPPWEHLPPVTPARTAADCAQRRRDAPPSTLRWRP